MVSGLVLEANFSCEVLCVVRGFEFLSRAAAGNH